jgi:LPXTG-motif cell wall-anchored protein
MHHAAIACTPIRLLIIATLLVGFVIALQPGTPAIQASPAYQPPVTDYYRVDSGVSTTIEAADDSASGPGGVCTLRDAISAVNAGAGPGVHADGCTVSAVGTPAANVYVIFLPTGGYTYTLDPANDELLTTANTVYIVGDTAANTIIQASTVDPTLPGPPPGAATYRVLRNNGASVELGNITIRHGRDLGVACAGWTNVGGGICNQAGTVTVDASTISANVAGSGGGIWNGNTLNVQNGSTVSANIAGSGGGIWNDGSLNIQNGSAVSANTATAVGGGICNWAGTVTVDASTVSANVATSSGGGILNEATLNIQNGSTIGGAGAGNQATNYGGGISNWYGTVTVDASTVSANTVITYGGGIWNDGTLNVQNGSTIGGAGAGNTARYGGGIFSDEGSTTTVDASTVSANSAADRGGGIYNNQDTLNVQNGSIIGGAGAGNQARDGGGIYNDFGTVGVDGSTVSANTATDGGGIWNSGTLDVQNGSTIGGAGAGNQATTNGGGIYITFSGATRMTDSRILYNTATNNGGGVYNDFNFPWATNVTASCIVGNSVTSFLNNQAAQQTATGNWWGTATGPNTPGADTVGGNVDTSGFLTAPILGCPANYPNLQVNKANDTGGNGTVGTTFNWTLTVANAGGVDATFTVGQKILEDDLPAGPTYGAPAPGNFVNITDTANIICAIVDNTLTCDVQGADVTIGATTGRFDVVVSVTPNAAGLLSNPAGNCRVDPNDNVAETDEGNNDCPTNNVNVAAPAPPPSGDEEEEEEEGPPPAPAPILAPKAQEFNCWPWLVIVPPGAAPNAIPGEWCQASLGQSLPAFSTFRYLQHSTEVTIKDAAGNPIAQFASPIKVCFHYTQPELNLVSNNPANFLIQAYRGGQWEALPTAPESSLLYPGVCAPVDHLTLFTLFARDEKTAAATSSGPLYLPETGGVASPLMLGLVGLLAAGLGTWMARRRLS